MRKSNRGGLLLPIILLLVIAACIGAAFKLHVVKTSEGQKYYGKKTPTLTDTWTDVTTWKVSNLREHPDLVEVMIKAGDARLLPGGPIIAKLYQVSNDIGQALTNLDNELKVSDTLGELQRIGEKKLDQLDKATQDAKDKLQKEADKLNQWLKKQ